MFFVVVSSVAESLDDIDGLLEMESSKRTCTPIISQTIAKINLNWNDICMSAIVWFWGLQAY